MDLNPPMTEPPPGERRHWLCISYAFPPINRSGTHRTLAFVRHLDRLGWDATVITVEPGGEQIDESLLARVPDGTHVVRTPWVDLIERVKALTPLVCRKTSEMDRTGLTDAEESERPRRLKPAAREAGTDARGGSVLREWVSRLLMTPDSRIGWIPSAVRAGMASVRRRRPDVIYSTSPYMSAHLAALVLRHRTGIPWVADFRDPWSGNPFRDLQFSSLERWDRLLERRVLKSAGHIICNTPTMTRRLRARYPAVAEKSSTILNGFDRELFEGLQATRAAPDDHFVMTHCGQFYGRRSPRVWFSALRRFLDESPQRARWVDLQLIGPDSFEGIHLAKLAADAGVASSVRVLGTMGHHEALSHMLGSDVLLLAGSSGPGSEIQVPQKLFEYLALRRPIIATAPARSPVVEILSEARADAEVVDPDDEAGIARVMRRFATRLRASQERAWQGIWKFDRAGRARELAAIFERLASGRRTTRGRITAGTRIPASAMATSNPVHPHPAYPQDSPANVRSARSRVDA